MVLKPSDAELVEQTIRGSRSAFDQLLDRYWSSAVSLARSYTHNLTDAEEAAQDAFVLAYQRIGQLRDARRFGGWLFTIVARRCLEASRRRRPTPVEDVEVLGESLAEGTPEPESESVVVRDSIQRAIAALPEHYRAVVVLRYGQDMSVKDISRTLDRPLGTVVSQIFRANRVLREQLQHLVAAGTGQR